MERYISLGVAVFALLVGLSNVWSLKGIGARLDALEQGQQAAARALTQAPPAPAVIPSPPGVAGAAAASPQIELLRSVAEKADLELTKDNLQDPVFREELASVVKAEGQRALATRQEEIRTSLTDEVEALGRAEGLSPRTIGQILGELERRSDLFYSIRQDLAAGDLSRIDALREIKFLQEDSDALLQELLGDEAFAILEERMRLDRTLRKR